MVSPPRKTQSDRSSETRGRILRSAQKLFALRGFKGVTMRSIASEAKVNLASLVYYFTNKEGLYLAVLRNYAEPLKQERMKLLAEVDKQGSPTLESYMRAFIEPAFRVMTDESLGGSDHVRMLWRIPQEPEHLLDRVYSETYLPVLNEMKARLSRFCDDDEMTLSWKIHMVNSIFHTTLGKLACDHAGLKDKEIWMQNPGPILERIIETAIILMRQPVSKMDSDGKV